MTPEARAHRAEIAAAVERAERPAAEAALAPNPDDRARQRAFEDASAHVRNLAGAIASGSPARFRDYARWRIRVALNRGAPADAFLDDLARVRDALGSRVPADAAALVVSYMDAGIDAARSVRVDGDSEPDAPGPLADACAAFTEAILAGDRARAAAIAVDAVDRGAELYDVYVDVLQNALYRVGKRWETNEITVAREHLATAITQFVISLLYARLPRTHTPRGAVVITGAQGEQHQVGPMMLADVLESDGWDVRFLGTNAPAEDVVATVRDHKADVLGISATMLFSIPRVRELIDMCRDGDGDQLRIIVGGQAFRAAPGLHEEVGAQAFAADLRQARAVLREWSS